MTAERARKTNKIRTDIHADHKSSAKKSSKKKKKIEAKLKHKYSDSEEDISEKPSTTSKNSSRSDGSSQRQGPAIDHHIKYSENEKLKKWLKEKDRLYRKNVKEEKKKKREEREKLINEANDKLERKLISHKRVKEWMKEKNAEVHLKHKEEKKKKEKEQGGQVKKDVVVPREEKESQVHSRRVNDVKVEKEKCKGQETPEYVKQQIHDKRDIEEENKQAARAERGGPHPPQTKFIYKRPVAGKIKLNMQNKGKNAAAQKPDSEKKDDAIKEREDRMRLSYDEWVKRKREDDVEKKKNAAKTKERELAKSDPELNRMIPDLAKRRIEDKMNMRKKVNTGIKEFDDEANKSFGGGEFDGEKERPRSAYRLEGDNRSKQTKRPSTAPAGRRMPHPTKSASSPRKAVIPQRVDKVMENQDDSNPYKLPFPPEKGIPAHVAARQRKLFADRVSDKLGENDQREMLQEVLEQEGVANIDESAVGQSDLQQPNDNMGGHDETSEGSKQADIRTVMYSPRKKEDSSESSESENDERGKNEDNSREVNSEETQKDNGKDNHESDNLSAHIDSFGTIQSDSEISQSNQEARVDIHNGNQYKTYNNLSDLPLDSPVANEDTSKPVGVDLGVDIEKLRERVELLIEDTTGPPLVFSNEARDSFESRSTDDESQSEAMDVQSIKVISEDVDPNLVGILKERKSVDNIPVPEPSEEPTESVHKGPGENGDSQLNPEDSFNASRKRVSFNEQTEVFQSSESSSTDTLTPEQQEFDPEAEGLDSQPFYGDDFERDEIQEDGLGSEIEGDKLSFNIAGIELNPTVIEPEVGEEERKEGESTFITNPDTN